MASLSLTNVMETLKSCAVSLFSLAVLSTITAAFSPALAQTDHGKISLGSTFPGNQTQRSRNGVFEVGLFTPSGSDLVYLGIWYADILPRTVVWVANREQPITSADAAFSLSVDGELLVLDAGKVVWSSSTKGLNVKAALLKDSGNFVLQTENSTFVWESFDHCGDTWLPTMKLRPGIRLQSWLSSSNPAGGLYTFEMRSTGELVSIWNGTKQYWTSGVWNGQTFSNIPEMANTWMYKFNSDSSGLSWSVSPTTTAGKGLDIVRFVMSVNGEMQQFMWSPQVGWTSFWFEPRDPCEVYGYCGKNGVCNSKPTTSCTCVKGFKPAEPQQWRSGEWASGCEAATALNRSSTETTLEQPTVKKKLLMRIAVGIVSGYVVVLLVILSFVVIRRLSISQAPHRSVAARLQQLHGEPEK